MARDLVVVFMGDLESGKTSVFDSLADKPFSSEHRPTLGCDFRRVDIGPILGVNLKDTGSKLQDRYYYNAEVGVYCLDLTKELDFAKIEKEIRIFQERAPNGVLLFVGTKKDLAATDNFNWTQLFSLAIRLGAISNIQRIETSAQNRAGINALRQQLIDSILLSQQLQKESILSESLKERVRILGLVEQSKKGQEKIPPLKASLAIASVGLFSAAVVFAIGFVAGLRTGLWADFNSFQWALLQGATVGIALMAAAGIVSLLAGGITAKGLGLFSSSSLQLEARKPMVTCEVLSEEKVQAARAHFAPLASTTPPG